MRVRVSVWILSFLCCIPVLAADPPALHFAGSTSAADVKVTLQDAAFAHELVIENNAAAPQEGVTVEVRSSIAIDCKLDDGAKCDAAFTVGAFRSRGVKLTATVPKAGTYFAIVSVAGKASRQSTTISISRTEPAFPAKLIGGAKTAEQTAGTLSVGIVLQDTSGKGATLNPPTVLLTRKAPSARGQVEVTFASSFHNDDEKRTAIGRTWTVPKDGSAKLLVDLELDEPGEYTGFVHLTSPGVSGSLDVPLHVWIKDGAACAAALIALGVVLSFLLRLLVRSVRPALAQYRNTARLAEDVRTIRTEIESKLGTLETREKNLLDGYEARLTRLAQQFETGESASATAELQEIDRKLSMTVRWVNARRRLATLPDAKHAELAAKLESVTTYLEGPTADGADAAQTTLGELDEAIDKAMREESDKNTTFRAQLDAAQATPLGFTDADWTALRGRTLAALNAAALEADPAQRRKKYDTAFLGYTSEVLKRLRDYAKSRLTRIEKDPNLEAAQKVDLKTRIEAIVTSLGAAESDAAAGKTREAATAATKGAADLLAVMQEVPGLLAGGEPVKAAPAAPAASEELLGRSIVALLARNLRLDSGSVSTLNRYLFTIDAVVALVALAIAILLGLMLLWTPDVDWGSAEDHIVAVLWGLGLHQVGNSTFSGISGLADKFK